MRITTAVLLIGVASCCRCVALPPAPPDDEPKLETQTAPAAKAKSTKDTGQQVDQAADTAKQSARSYVVSPESKAEKIDQLGKSLFNLAV